MRSQNQVLLTTSHTGRVQLITEVQVQEVLHGHTVLQHQVQATTEAVHRYAAAVAEVIAEVEVAAEAVVHTRQEVLVEVLPVEVAVEADLVVAVVLHPVGDNFRKQKTF